MRDFLISFESAAVSANAAPEWFGAIAMLHGVAEGKVKEELREFLEKRAALTTRASPIGWFAAERAIAAGLELEVAIAERYLTEATDLLNSLRAQVNSGSLGGGLTDIPELTEWASRVCSSETRERALMAAVNFLGTPGHLLFERVRWVFFIARLARQDPALIDRAIAALSAVARGDLRPASRFDDYQDPYSTFQVQGHTASNVISDAMHSLIALIPTASASGREAILEILEEGIADVDPEVRRAVATATGWLFSREVVGADAREQLVNRVITPLTGDHVDSISVAALRTLNETLESQNNRP